MLPNCDNSAARIAAVTRLHKQLPHPRQARSGPREAFLVATPVNLNVQVAYLLAQRVAVKAEQVGGAVLIAARGSQCRREQRHLDLLEYPMIEARRRHAVRKTG